MNIDKITWSAITSRIADTLPACDVVRTYDPEKSLGELDELTKTTVLVCLAGKVSTMVSQKDVREDFEFRIFAVDYIESQDDAEKTAEMDALLTLPPTIYDACAFQNLNVTEGNETLNIKLIAGDDYTVEYLTTYETFIACISLKVSVIRQNVPTIQTTPTTTS